MPPRFAERFALALAGYEPTGAEFLRRVLQATASNPTRPSALEVLRGTISNGHRVTEAEEAVLRDRLEAARERRRRGGG